MLKNLKWFFSVLFLLPLFFIPDAKSQCNVIIQPGTVQVIDVNPGIKFTFTLKNNSTLPYQSGTFNMSFGWLDNPISPDPAWTFNLTQSVPPGGTLNITTPVFDVPLPSNATEWPFWDDLTGPNGWPNSNYGPLMLYLNNCYLNSVTVNSFLPLSDDCPNINNDQFCDCNIEVYDFRTEPEMEMDLVIHSDYNCYSSGFPPGSNSFNSNNPGINSFTLGVKSLIENTCGSTENNGYSFLHFNSFVIPDYVLGDTITLQIDQALNYNIYTCFQDLYNSGYFDGCFEAVLWQINNSYNVLGTVNNPEITISDNLIYVDTNCPTVVNNTDLSIDSFSYDIIGCDVGSPYASMNITVLNEGNTIINEFCMTLDILPDNLPSVQYCFDNLSILPGESYVVEVNGSPLSNGVTSISITTPNDGGFSNNSFVGIIDLPCYGCTLTSAINYDPYATVDDGSCIIPILGCTDPQGLNYNPFATVDDGSCIYLVLGCTDPQASNYNPNANMDDNSCNYDVLGCTDPQANNYNPNANIDNGSCTYDVLGCTDPQANNYNPNANVDNGSCTYDVLGCTDPQANNYNPNANVDNGSCTYDVLGCTDPQANNYNPNANVDDNSCTYDVLGCTDVTAFNYNPNANVDDNSCEYEGCTNPQALNYDPNATLEDGTCIFPPTIDECDDVNVFIPNAFTPNNDGVNDSWYIVTNNDCWLEWSLTIYNRWGGLIWESNDPNDVWIGNVNGGDYYVADGLYVYRIIAKGERGRVYSNSGNITVLR